MIAIYTITQLRDQLIQHLIRSEEVTTSYRLEQISDSFFKEANVYVDISRRGQGVEYYVDQGKSYNGKNRANVPHMYNSWFIIRLKDLKLEKEEPKNEQE